MHEVIEFWFQGDTKPFWFQPTPAFDQTIRKRFGELYARAATGELREWESTGKGCLALCLLLDQMPRNMFRGDRRAFASDSAALAIAERALLEGWDRELTTDQKLFLYRPFLHSEQLSNQLRALALFEAQGIRDGRAMAQKTYALIRRFGRFPERNAPLGRATTAEEQLFLDQEAAPPPAERGPETTAKD